jgi:hypothetical protein
MERQRMVASKKARHLSPEVARRACRNTPRNSHDRGSAVDCPLIFAVVATFALAVMALNGWPSRSTEAPFDCTGLCDPRHLPTKVSLK